MFRRPSLAQSVSSAVGNENKAPPVPAHLTTGKRSVSNTTSIAISDNHNINIDELFTKHTVGEIRVIQNHLRADANAKKEELRQMVGERYRDLLQASSSIISIAQSSQRIVRALEESRDALESQQDPPLRKATTSTSTQDRHLHALQVLAAHMKLLLDAPEHLWRLIERKKFFPAAWLFLLARVVHRALVRNDSDDQEEENWKSQGVDVLVEFPLIQRQWEVVSQFRSQIIHKATLSLRDAGSSVEDTCATLVTLHLLDSRPLHDALSAMFSQRLKTLTTLLTATPQSISQSTSKTSMNGHASAASIQDMMGPISQRPRIREVKESLQNTLMIISQTMHAARGIFDATETGRSLIERVLENIQSHAENNIDIPPDLHLSTQALLTNITSAAHFQLLPSNLRSYRPYVDLTSSSASLRKDRIASQANEWFIGSTKLLHNAIGAWFRDLDTVKEVWSVRAASRKWIRTSVLVEEEKARVSDIVDEICRERVIDIWKLMVREAMGAFETSLETSLSTIDGGASAHEAVHSPVDFLFNTISLPSISQSTPSYDIPIRKYQSALKRQLLGRTALLDKVLNTLEHCARHIHEEILYIRSGVRNEPRSIVDHLVQLHEPVADNLTKTSIGVLEKAIHRTEGNDEKTMKKLIFLEQVTDDLVQHSSFIEQIGCAESTRHGFLQDLIRLNDMVLDAWSRKAVSSLVHRTDPCLSVIPVAVNGPDLELLQALILLCESLQRVSFRWSAAKQARLFQGALRLFIEQWMTEGPSRAHLTKHDLLFLQVLLDLITIPDDAEIMKMLKKKIKAMDEHKVEVSLEAFEHIKRLQMFLPATLTGTIRRDEGWTSPKGVVDKFPNLLRYGQPSMERQQLQTALDVGKPGPRFGLLLVGGDIP